MKRLYVGCRVRVVNSTNYPEVVGREARVVAIDVPAWNQVFGHYRGVETDLLVRGKSTGKLIALKPPPEHLEPIQDPGHQIVSWSECLWQPEGQPA